jgi:putative transcriptional regulator
MTVRHHPSEALQLDYASGALTEAWSLAVATHLALCPVCRKTVAGIEAVGGAMLASLEPSAVSASGFDSVWDRIGREERDTPEIARPAAVSGSAILPSPLRDYVESDLDGLAWQRLGLGAYQLPIDIGEADATARLLRIPAGRPVPEHTHRGLELTLVLCGAFSDTTGDYGPGDFQEADDTLKHQPHAAPGEDCVCLAVTDAPLYFSSFAARLVQPLIGI